MSRATTVATCSSRLDVVGLLVRSVMSPTRPCVVPRATTGTITAPGDSASPPAGSSAGGRPNAILRAAGPRRPRRPRDCRASPPPAAPRCRGRRRQRQAAPARGGCRRSAGGGVGARHEPLVDRLGDLDEGHLPRQLEHREVDLVRLAAHRVGDRLEVVPAFHHHRDGARLEHPGRKPALKGSVVAEVVGGREQEVSRGEVVGEVVEHLHPLHPLHLAAEAAAAGPKRRAPERRRLGELRHAHTAIVQLLKHSGRF